MKYKTWWEHQVSLERPLFIYVIETLKHGYVVFMQKFFTILMSTFMLKHKLTSDKQSVFK